MVFQNIPRRGTTAFNNRDDLPFSVTFFGAPFEAIGKAAIGLPDRDINRTLRQEMQNLGLILTQRVMAETPRGVTGKLSSQVRPRHSIIPGTPSSNPNSPNASSTSGDIHVLEIVQDASTEISDDTLSDIGIPSRGNSARSLSYDSFRYRGQVALGRRPGLGMPPWKLLRPWVMKKWGLTIRESAHAAFSLAQSIRLRGTKPNDFIERAIQQSAPDFKRAALTIGRNVQVISVDRLQRAFSEGTTLARL